MIADSELAFKLNEKRRMFDEMQHETSLTHQQAKVEKVERGNSTQQQISFLNEELEIVQLEFQLEEEEESRDSSAWTEMLDVKK